MKHFLLLTLFVLAISGKAQTLLNESFDGTTFPPAGWVNQGLVGTNIWSRETVGWSPECIPHSGMGMVMFNSTYFTSNNSAVLISPEINLTALGSKTATLTFWMNRDIYYSDSVGIYINTLPDISGAAWIGKIIQDYSLAPVEAKAGWYRYIYNLPATFNGTKNYIIFKGVSKRGFNIYIDDVSVRLPYVNDASVSNITSPTSSFIKGTNTVKATIMNYGSALLKSAVVNWSVNNVVQTPVSFTNAIGISTNSNSEEITLGTYNFSADGTYSIKVWTTLPNGLVDENSADDLKTKSCVTRTVATLPYIQNFESSWIDFNGVRDVPSSCWKNTPEVGNNSWSREDDGMARGSWSNTNNFAYTPSGANGTGHSATYNTGMSRKDGFLDLYVDFSTLSGSKALYFYCMNGVGSHTLDISVSIDGGSTFSAPLKSIGSTDNLWEKFAIDLGNLTSANGVIRFTGKYNCCTSSTRIGIDEVYVGNHSTTPLVANFTQDKTTGIAPLSVSFSDKSTGDVISWAWDFNNDGMTDATTKNPTYTFTTPGVNTVSLTVTKPGYSDVAFYDLSLSAQQFAPLPYKESFDNDWVNREGIKDVPSLFNRNSTSTPDQLHWGKYTNVNYLNGDYLPIGANGTPYSARFNSGFRDVWNGSLDFFVDFSTQVGSKTLSFWYINNGGGDKLEVLLSLDGGTTFSAPIFTSTIVNTWTKVVYDLGNLTTSKGLIRFKGTATDYSGSNTQDIGLDELQISVPTAVNVDAHFVTDKISGVAPLTVKFSDQSNGVPTAWSWDFNNDGVVDATTQNPTYIFTSPGVYTVKYSVSKTGSTDTEIQTNCIVVSDVASLPFTENFESNWVSKNGNRDVPNQFWTNTPAMDDKSWSREDDGELRGAWSSINGSYLVKGANGTNHSASFNSYHVSNGSGALDLAVNFSTQTGNKLMSFWYLNKEAVNKLEVMISLDGGLTFGPAVSTSYAAQNWTKIILDLGNLTAIKGVIRFKATSPDYYDYYNIGIDEIKVWSPSASPLNADFSVNKISGSAPFVANFTDVSDGAPTSWAWDFNNDGTVDATTQNSTYTFTQPGVYSVKQTITKGGISDVELKTNSVLATGYASLPYKESFEGTWVNRDGVRDVPSPYIKNSPAMGWSSWSRDDDGFARGAWSSNEYSYTPSGANGTSHSARSKRNSNGDILDISIDLSSSPNIKLLKFWLLNPAVGQIDVYISIDGGVTFGPSLKTYGYVSSWTQYYLSLGNITSSTAVVRLKATANGGGYYGIDMGLDEIEILPLTAPSSPTGVTAVAGIGQATVSFIAPISDGGSLITSYDVICQQTGTIINCTSSPSTFTGLTNGTAYTFTVVAKNSIGSSVPSSPSVAVTPLSTPGIPTGLTALAGNAKATITFVPPVLNGGTPITGYIIYAYPGGATLSATSSPAIFSGLTNGTSYTFRIRAVNSVGNGGVSGASNAVTPTLASALELHNDDEFELYPNPVKTGFHIFISQMPVELEIYDITGVLLLKQIVEGKSYVDISDFSVGTYVLKVNGSYSKIVKVK